MKAVMLSIRPQWCELIANGRKTLEVRKTRPQLETPFKCYIYCTRIKGGTLHAYGKPNKRICAGHYGKVVGEFVCDKILKLSIYYSDPDSRIALKEFPGTALTDKQIIDYLGNGKDGWAWRISGLCIYDKPKELSEFTPHCKYLNDDESCQHRKVDCDMQERDYNPDRSLNFVGCGKKMKRPPQSWCYVEDKLCSE